MKSKSTPQLDLEEKPPLKGEVLSASYIYLYHGKKKSEGLLIRLVHVSGLYSVGVNVKQTLWLGDRPLRGGHDTQAQSQWAASDLDLKRRCVLNAIKIRGLERGGLSPRAAASLPNQEVLQAVLHFDPLIT